MSLIKYFWKSVFINRVQAVLDLLIKELMNDWSSEVAGKMGKDNPASLTQNSLSPLVATVWGFNFKTDSSRSCKPLSVSTRISKTGRTGFPPSSSLSHSLPKPLLPCTVSPLHTVWAPCPPASPLWLIVKIVRTYGDLAALIPSFIISHFILTTALLSRF